MKDITLKIIGKQFNGEKSEELVEFVTEGKLYEKGDSTYLIYDESGFSGFPGCKTSLKLTGNKVRMKRIGKDAGYGTEMVFEQGKRFLSKYQTPYGDMDLEVMTNSVKTDMKKDGTGNIDIDYHVAMSGLAEGRNKLKIQVM